MFQRSALLHPPPQAHTKLYSSLTPSKVASPHKRKLLLAVVIQIGDINFTKTKQTPEPPKYLIKHCPKNRDGPVHIAY